MKPGILVFVSRYLPGVKSGGPIRSIANMAEALGDEFEFRLVTTDRDKDDTRCYEGIVANRWHPLGKAKVLYLSEDRLTLPWIYRLLASESADVLYLNSFFSSRFSILPALARKAGARRQKTLMLAPRGEFSPGALRFGNQKKRAYIGVSKGLRLYDGAVWHASSVEEERDIRRVMGDSTVVRIALPLSGVADGNRGMFPPQRDKSSGTLRVAFLSRIVPKKNLLGAIQMLRRVSGQVRFDIYGPPEDADYWHKCQAQIQLLPENIHARFHSVVAHGDVGTVLSDHHLLLFPTHGENYGHVIFEALNAGCPVLISDQTPWKGLEGSNAGWEFPLEMPDLFEQAIQRCIDMTAEEFAAMSQSARRYVRDFVSANSALEANRQLFRFA